jgi:hypothetical protein
LNADPVPTVCAKLLTIELFLMRNLGSTMPCFDEPIVPMTLGNNAQPRRAVAVRDLPDLRPRD